MDTELNKIIMEGFFLLLQCTNYLAGNKIVKRSWISITEIV